MQAPSVYGPHPQEEHHRLLFVLILIELRPAALEETPHRVSGHAHLRCVLVEELTVVEDELGVGRKLLTAAVPGRGG